MSKRYYKHPGCDIHHQRPRTAQRCPYGYTGKELEDYYFRKGIARLVMLGLIIFVVVILGVIAH